MDMGSITYSPKDQKAYRKRKAEEEKRRLQGEQRRFWRKNAGQFYFASTESHYKNLRPATMVRLVYLATYIGYTGKLQLTERSPMKRDSLQKILCVSKSETYRFWGEVKDQYVFECDDGQLSMSDDFFFRGKLSYGRHYQQLYIAAIRKLYQQTTPTKHKYLGYVFQMLPFINVEFNILCHNPDEKDLDNVNPLTIDEFCKTVGYSSANRARLLQEYAGITFLAGAQRECFCSFVTNGGNIGKARMFVNPHIIYHGSNGDNVQLLGKFCKV